MEKNEPFIEQEITPPHLRCSPSACPGVFSLSDGNLLVIGEALSLWHVASDEKAIAITADYFGHLVSRPSKKRLRIVGRKVEGALRASMNHKIGRGEEAVIIPPDYLEVSGCGSLLKTLKYLKSG